MAKVHGKGTVSHTVIDQSQLIEQLKTQLTERQIGIAQLRLNEALMALTQLGILVDLIKDIDLLNQLKLKIIKGL